MIDNYLEDYSKVIGEQEYTRLWREQSRPTIVVQTKRLDDSEVVIDYNLRERLEKEFSRDYDSTVDSDLAQSRIAETVSLYQNIMDRITNERIQKWSGGSVADLLGQLNTSTSEDVVGPKTLSSFDPTILGIISFYLNSSLPVLEDSYNFLWKNWDLGEVTSIGTKDSVTKKVDFFQELLFRQGRKQGDPHFINEILVESTILPNRRPFDTDQVRLPHDSRQHFYLSTGADVDIVDRVSSLTSTNLGKRSFNKISEVTGGNFFEYTVAVKPGGYDFYQFPGTSFNWTNLEIDYYQLYLNSPQYGLNKPVFYHYGLDRVMSLDLFEEAYRRSGGKTYVYPKGKIEIPRGRRVDIDDLISKNRLGLLDFLYFGEARVERGQLSRNVTKQRGQAKWTDKTGLKYICDNLSDVKKVMQLFGQHPSQLVRLTVDKSGGQREVVQFDYETWTKIASQLSVKVSRRSKKGKLTSRTQFMPNIHINQIFRYFGGDLPLSYYQNLPCSLVASNNLQRKVILESTQDNGERVYRQSDTFKGVEIKCAKPLEQLVNDTVTQFNAYNRLNNSMSSRLIMPKKSENLVEFDRFPGFDKKSVLKFSGINLLANWERNQARRYRNESVKYEPEYLPYSFVDSLVKEFLERKIHTKLVLEQINLYRWDTYHELKTFPFDTMSWQCLQKVLAIPDLRKCPPTVIYFYYLLFYLVTIATTAFKKLYQNLVRRRISIDIREIIDYLTSKPDQITLKSHQVLPFRLDDLVKKVLLDYHVKSTEKKKIAVGGGVEIDVYVDNTNINFAAPNNFRTTGSIYLDETRTHPIYIRSDSVNYPFNFGSIFNTGLPVCYYNNKNGQIVNSKIDGSRFEEPRKSSKSSTKSVNVDKYQEVNNVVYHWLRNLVLDKSGNENVVFGSHYSRVSSSVFNDFLGKNRNFLTQQDLLLMVGSFYYIFLNSYQLQVMPIYWGRYSVQSESNVIRTNALLNITPFNVNCDIDRVADGSKYQFNVDELVTKLLNTGETTVVFQVDKRIGPIPRNINVSNIANDRVAQFNLAFQKVFYQSLDNPTIDKKLVETELTSILKSEQLEPKGSFTPKMYDFNRWQDYLIWLKAEIWQKTNLQKGVATEKDIVSESLNKFFEQYTRFNPIFGSNVEFHNPSRDSLESVASRLDMNISPSYPGLEIEVTPCHKEATSNKTLSNVAENDLSSLSDWFVENGYMGREHLGSSMDINLKDSIHMYFYRQLSTNEENKVETRPGFITSLRGDFTENDRGLNFSQIFSFDAKTGETTYDIASARVSLSKDATIFTKSVDMPGQIRQIFTNDWEIYGRLVRYFKYWLSTVPFRMGQISILRDSGKVIKRMHTFSRGVENQVSLADYFLKVLIVSVIPTESQLADLSLRTKIRDSLTPFSFYIKTMERDSNHFFLSKYGERRQAEEMQRINKLRSDATLNKQMRLAPKHLKNEELVRNLTGTGE